MSAKAFPMNVACAERLRYGLDAYRMKKCFYDLFRKHHDEIVKESYCNRDRAIRRALTVVITEESARRVSALDMKWLMPMFGLRGYFENKEFVLTQNGKEVARENWE